MREVVSITGVIRWATRVVHTLVLVFIFSLSFAKAELLVTADSPNHNFGTIREGDSITHVFRVTNRSDQTLRIKNIIPGCGCVRVKYPREPIPPGVEIPMAVTFLSEGFSGPVRTAVRIDLDSPKISHIDLSLQGHVKAALAVKPERILFPDIIQSRGSDVQEVAVSGIRSADFSVRPLKQSVSISNTSRSGETVSFGVQISPDAPVGELRERIVVREASKEGRSVIIPVFAIIKPALELSRATITFLNNTGQAKLSESVLLNYFGQGSIGNPRAVFRRGHRGISVQVKEVDPGRTWELSFSIDMQKVAGSLDELVTILGDDDEGPAASLRLLLPAK
jgi:hypothetical protein